MDRAARSVLFFAIIGLLTASSVIGVFQSVPFVAKDGTVSVYLASNSPDIQSDTNVSEGLATEGAQPSVQIISLNVTIDSVSVHRSGAFEGSGWTVITNTPVTLDVVKTTNVTMLIAMGQIPEQNISMVRLHVTSARAAVKNSQGNVEVKPVVVSSSELKIPLGSMRVRGQLNTDIILANEPHIVVQGNGTIRLTPVLHVKRITGPQ